MKNNILTAISIRIALVLLLSTLASSLPAFAQGTAFTYQGRLQASGSPANGLYDFRFRLFSDSQGNNQAGNTLLTNSVAVSNGLFIVTLDFGAGVFGGSNYWLEVDVTTNAALGYVDLTPLQEVTPAPYAIFAENASISGLSAGTSSNAITLNNPANSFTGTFAGNGGGVTNVNSLTLDGLSASGFWKSTGNSGTVPGLNFLGTIDSQPLEMWVNQTRALRLAPDTNGFGAPNLIGGAPNNFVDPGVFGATIAGGGVLNFSAAGGYEQGPGSNHVSANWGFIGGGRRNTVAGDHAVITGGHDNLIGVFGYDSVVGGGDFNVINYNSLEAVISGGIYNTVQSNSYFASIGGGSSNTASGVGATVAGGCSNNASSLGATVAGGATNAASFYFDTVGGGEMNTAEGGYSAVGGGYGNTAENGSDTVGGGYGNTASGGSSTVPGGEGNVANGILSTVAGGYGNLASGNYSAVPGGNANVASGEFSFAAGQNARAQNTGSFVWADNSGATYASTANNQFAVRAAGGAVFAADMQLSGGAAYHNFSLSGGNSTGYLYGSYPALGDGIHLGYNYYYDANGNGHVFNTGGPTSRLTVGYGFISLNVSLVTNSPPTTPRLLANSAGVTVYGTFTQSSDRNAKQDFAPISPSQLLDKVLELPLSEWSYKTDASTRHIGPMAQDFHSIFSVGADEKHIAPVDESGVAFAAIQGLNRKVDAELAAKQAEIAELKQRLEALEKAVSARKE